MQCRRWPQNSKAAAAFSPELWRDAAPCNLPSVGARRAVRPAFLCRPTATHESSGHSCSRWGEMSPRWQSVLCICVRMCFLPHKRVLLLYKWPESHPRGNVGKTIAGWRGCVGVAYCMRMHICCPQSSWTCLCIHAHEILVSRLWTLHKFTPDPETAASRILQPCNRQIASTAPLLCCVMRAQYSSRVIDYSAAKSFHPAVKLCISNHRGYPLQGWDDPNGWRLTVNPQHV